MKKWIIPQSKRSHQDERERLKKYADEDNCKTIHIILKRAVNCRDAEARS